MRVPRPSMPDEDGPTIMATTTLAASKDDGTYETPSKSAIPITAYATLIPSRLEDTSARPDCWVGWTIRWSSARAVLAGACQQRSYVRTRIV
jgi:hypothetical protein